MHALAGGFRMQFWSYLAYPDQLLPLLTAPVFSVIFWMIFRHAGRPDLAAYSVVAPVFIAIWWFTLFHGGMIIQIERWSGTVELLVAAPSAMALSVLGRTLAVALASLVAFPEMLLVGRYVLREPVTIHHPWVFVATLFATAFAMATTALFMAAAFVLSRSAVTISNSASYPFYVLGGILVPVSFLPDWVRPLSSLVFLSWSSDLFRSVLGAAPVQDPAWRVGMLVVLAVGALACGEAVLALILRRVRGTGELGLQ